MNNVQTYLANMTDIERQLLSDRVQYRLDSAVRGAFKEVLAEVSPLCPFEVTAAELLRELCPDTIDCYQVIDDIVGENE